VADVWNRIARMRVPAGFAVGAAVLWFARPTWTMMAAGTAVAAAGELIRIWAAGHLEKSREVTRSGPYRWSRHPLYVGSAFMGAGVAIAGNNAAAAAAIGLYLAITRTAAVRTEEAFLRSTFGKEYDEYCRGISQAPGRAFSWARVWRNREYRAVAGMGAVLAILAFKASVIAFP
jgi:protein-S-isoprenylcysteine O-methyltransferase Ste14